MDRFRAAALLAKSVLTYKDLTVHSNLTGRKYPIYYQGAANSGPYKAQLEVIEENDGEEIIYKPSLLGRIKGRK